MDVKQAVSIAKTYLADLLVEEKVRALTLEEVWFEEGTRHWRITLGVHRDLLPGQLLGAKLGPDYKSLRVSDKDGKVVSVRNRDNEAA